MGVGLLVLAVGAFTLLCAAMDFDWFMENRKAQRLVRLMGRGGARVFYGGLGVALIGLAAWLIITKGSYLGGG